MATMVMEMHLNVMLYVHCLSCFPIANYNRYHSKRFVPTSHSKQHATNRHSSNNTKIHFKIQEQTPASFVTVTLGVHNFSYVHAHPTCVCVKS